jgi:hypothetical protein
MWFESSPHVTVSNFDQEEPMKRNGYSLAVLAIVVSLGLWSAVAGAGDGRTCPGVTPNPNGVLINERTWNDCPLSTLSVTNSYPASIVMHDQMYSLCVGFTNMHNWQFSADGGTTRIAFENCSAYHFCANVTVTGVGNGEAGINLSPWWFPEAGGKFMLNVGTGEIACFDGRLPYYSFTANHGISYVRGTTVTLEMTYLPNGLSETSPATVEYKITIGPNTYSSGALAFDQGNIAEDPPHGLWGALVPHYAGGYFQPNVTGGTGDLTVLFENICFDNLQYTPTAPLTWGRLKMLYR